MTATNVAPLDAPRFSRPSSAAGLPVVEISAPDRDATEKGPHAAHLTVTRSGGDLHVPLTVHYSVGGTAENGVKYRKLDGSVTIRANQTSATLTVLPIPDRILDPTQTVTLRLAPSPAYAVAPHSAVTVFIVDSGIYRDWPAEPFVRNYYTKGTSIYVNQFGFALLKGQPLSPRKAFKGYNLFFDDPGNVKVSTAGTVATDLAYYNQFGAQPLTVDARGVAGAFVRAPVSPNKDLLGVAVRPHVKGTSGTFDLRIQGVPFFALNTIGVDPKTNAGSSGADINGSEDYDFYRFTLPRPGNWVVQVIPDNLPHPDESAHLHATMNVYDAAGNPVGGTFTSPIDAGAGHDPTWTGIGLKAKSVYYVRVDGAGDSTGGYGVSVALAQATDVAVSATRPTVPAGGPGAGQFTVTRVDNTPRSLTVHYTVSGTAVAGVDYQALSGSVTIPADQLSATIAVTALKGATSAADKTVVLNLSPQADYNLTSQGTAVVTLLGRGTGR